VIPDVAVAQIEHEIEATVAVEVTREYQVRTLLLHERCAEKDLCPASVLKLQPVIGERDVALTTPFCPRCTQHIQLASQGQVVWLTRVDEARTDEGDVDGSLSERRLPLKQEKWPLGTVYRDDR